MINTKYVTQLFGTIEILIEDPAFDSRNFVFVLDVREILTFLFNPDTSFDQN